MPVPSRNGRTPPGCPTRLSVKAQRLVSSTCSMLSAARRSGQLLLKKAAELDLTYAQSQVLFYVAEHSGCHMGDVAKGFGVTLPTVTHTIDRLEQKQFVVRGTDPADRRVSVLELTPTGRELVAELHALQLRGVEPVLSRGHSE